MEWRSEDQNGYQTQRLATSLVGAAQYTGITTSGQAIEVTAFVGQKVSIYVSATCRVRWQAASTPLTMATTDGGATRSSTTQGAGVANSGSVLVGPALYDRNVPALTPGVDTAMYLIVVPPSGTVDVNVTLS